MDLNAGISLLLGDLLTRGAARDFLTFWEDSSEGLIQAKESRAQVSTSDIISIKLFSLLYLFLKIDRNDLLPHVSFQITVREEQSDVGFGSSFPRIIRLSKSRDLCDPLLQGD